MRFTSEATAEWSRPVKSRYVIAAMSRASATRISDAKDLDRVPAQMVGLESQHLGKGMPECFYPSIDAVHRWRALTELTVVVALVPV